MQCHTDPMHCLCYVLYQPVSRLFALSVLPNNTAAKSCQLCPTLSDPMDCSQPGSPIPGILQARTLEWVAISFSNAWKWKVKVKWLSCIQLLATPWTAAYQLPLSMGFSRQEYHCLLQHFDYLIVKDLCLKILPPQPILCFWCHISHLHVYTFTDYCSYT